MAKRAAAGTLALAVCLTGGIVSAGAANAAAGFTFNTRIAGEDRYLTSVEASKAAFPNGAGSIVITNGLSEVDGLTASYVAGLHSAPILYTSGPTTVSAAVQAEITRLKPTTVYIVGGETVVSKATEDAMKATYGATNVIRYGGSDRYETAAKVATSGTAKPGKVIVASGVSFADALVAGPVAYKQKYPILLTAATGVPSYTEAALTTLAVPTVNVVGGTTVVTEATYTAVGGDKRLAGDTRQETAIKVADDAIANEGFSSANVALVGNTNANAADALVAAPLAAINNTPILFIDNNGAAKPTANYLTANSAKLTGTGYVFGGTTAVPAAAVAAAQTAAQTSVVGNQTVAVNPKDAVTLALATEASPATTASNADNRVYTASGLTAGETYRVTVVNSSSIRTDANGAVTFLSNADSASLTGYSVAVGNQDAQIVAVNNSAIGAAVTATTVPVNGSITFELDGTALGSVTPVVYLDGGAGQTAAQGGTSIRLETAATAVGAFASPVEPFGLGGAVTYTGIPSANGTLGVNTPGSEAFVAVASVDKDGNAFTVGTGSYKYDANDTFTIGTTVVGITAFEAAISAGDGIRGTYNADAEAVSQFVLNDVDPAAVTAVATAGTGANSSTALVTATIAGSPDSVIVQRAPVTSGTVGIYATIATVAATDSDIATADTQFRYTDSGLAVGTYKYRVAVVNDGDTGEFGTASADVVIATADTTAPTVLDTRVATNAGSALLLEAGDSFKVVASEVLAGPTEAGSNRSTLRLTDADGTVVEVVADIANNAPNGSRFALNTAAESVGGTSYPAGRVLTVTIGATAPILVTGSTAGLGIPSTITTVANVTDVAGNAVTLSGGDAVIDVE